MSQGSTQPELNGWLGIPDLLAATSFARAGFDSVTIDLQHGLFDNASAVAVLLALAAPTPRRYVRVLANDGAMLGRMLDAGADGLIVPMVNGPDEAASLVAACRYPPHGVRSFGPVLARHRPPIEPVLFAMIETRAAFEAVDAIAAVPGLGGLFVGPNDLGLALGHGAGSDREEAPMLDALATVTAATRRHGKRAGIYCASAEYARRIAGSHGFDVVTIAADVAVLESGGAGAVGRFGKEQALRP